MKKTTIRKKKTNGTVAGKSKISQELYKDEKSSSPFFAIAIGTSAGGINVIQELVSQLPAQINAAIFIVVHVSGSDTGYLLTNRIKQSTSLTCKLAINYALIEPGCIYVAPANTHLLVKNGRILLGHGPPENRFRPSIDILFRSVAAHYGVRAIGIVLSGLLSDGTAGMDAIKKSGGSTIVQNPNDAEYPDMPLSVMENVPTDHSVPVKRMGEVILGIIDKKKLNGVVPPAEVVLESRISEKMATAVDEVSKLGEHTDYGCPDCGGPLWRLNNKPFSQYRCHIGHSYLEKDLLSKQAEVIENTLWVAIRMMEEKRLHLAKIAAEHHKKGYQKLSAQYKERSEHLDKHIDNLKDLLFRVNKD